MHILGSKVNERMTIYKYIEYINMHTHTTNTANCNKDSPNYPQNNY